MSNEAKKKGSPDEEPTSSPKAKELKLLVNRQEESSIISKLRKAGRKFLQFVSLGRFASSLYMINGILSGCFRHSLSRKGLDSLGGLSLKAEASWVKLALDIDTLMPSKGGAAASFLEMRRSAELVSQFKDSFSQEIKLIRKEKKSDKASLLKRFVQYYKLYSKKQQLIEERIEELQNLLEEEYRQAAYIEDEISVVDYLAHLVERQNESEAAVVSQATLVANALKCRKAQKAPRRIQQSTIAAAFHPAGVGAPISSSSSSYPPFIIDEPEISLHGQKIAAAIADRFRRDFFPVAINIFNVNIGADAQHDAAGKITIGEDTIAQIQKAFMSATGSLLSKDAPQMIGLDMSNQVNAYLYSNMVGNGKGQSRLTVDVSQKSTKAIAREVTSQLKAERHVRPPKTFFVDPKKMTKKQRQQHDIRLIRAIQSFDANTTPHSTIGIEEAAKRAEKAKLLIHYKNGHSASSAYRRLKNSVHPKNWEKYCYSPPNEIEEIKDELDSRES